MSQSSPFNVHIPFSKQKVWPNIMKTSGGGFVFLDKDSNIINEYYLEGIASTTSIDRDTEKMSEKALWKMKKEVLDHPVNIFGNHDHNWENALGVIKEADVRDRAFYIKMLLDDPQTNTKVAALISKLSRGIELGLSIGGRVIETKEEFSKDLNKRVTVIDDLELFEVSVVGIPSNRDCTLSIPQQIIKSANAGKSQKIAITKTAESKCQVCFSKEFITSCKRCGDEI